MKVEMKKKQCLHAKISKSSSKLIAPFCICIYVVMWWQPVISQLSTLKTYINIPRALIASPENEVSYIFANYSHFFKQKTKFSL